MRLRQLTEAPRSVRNNNPGNIRISKADWQGKVGNDGEFETFDSPEMGARAMAKLLTNYQSKYGLNTVNGIINRWAPASDNNDPKGYAAQVARNMGIDPNDEIDLRSNPEMLRNMMSYMINVEGGRGANNYFTNDIIDNGIQLAFGNKIQPTINVRDLPKPSTSRFNIKRGAKGNEVKSLQRALISLGYDLGSYGADGDFGKATLRALKKFQKDYGLKIDGIAGNQTMAALQKLGKFRSA